MSRPPSTCSTRMEACDLEFAEQPVAGIEDLAALRRRVRVPIAADECVRTPADARRLRVLDAADVIVLKVQPLGGVRAALAVAAEAGMAAVVTSMLETSIGLAAGLALACRAARAVLRLRARDPRRARGRRGRRTARSPGGSARHPGPVPAGAVADAARALRRRRMNDAGWPPPAVRAPRGEPRARPEAPPAPRRESRRPWQRRSRRTSRRHGRRSRSRGSPASRADPTTGSSNPGRARAVWCARRSGVVAAARVVTSTRVARGPCGTSAARASR